MILLLTVSCHYATDATWCPTTEMSDYGGQLTLSLSSARQLAVESVQRAQKKYKRNYDKTATPAILRTGEWVLVHFPQEEQGKNRKLSRPWHGPYRVTSIRGPYRVTSIRDPDVSVVKVYFPQDPGIWVHQSRVKSCPPSFPAGFYWYGGNDVAPGILLSGFWHYWTAYLVRTMQQISVMPQMKMKPVISHRKSQSRKPKLNLPQEQQNHQSLHQQDQLWVSAITCRAGQDVVRDELKRARRWCNLDIIIHVHCTHDSLNLMYVIHCWDVIINY